MKPNHCVAVFCGALLLCSVSHSAPDEDALGKSRGYPKGMPQTALDDRFKVGSFSAMDEVFPSRKVARAGSVWELGEGTLPAVKYNFRDTSFTLEDYLKRQRVTSLLVLKDGKVLFERYQYDRKPEQRHMSWSMAKSITALLVGIAVEKGLIKSLDDKIETYAPEFKGSGYGDKSIRNLLLMGSGVAWDENYGVRSDVNDLWGAMFRIFRAGNPTSVLTSRRLTEAPQGTRFKYATGETQVLCHVLHGATKKDVASLTQEWLWGPLGAQAEASWLVGWQGIEYCGGGFNATTRDYARLGHLLALGGARDGVQIVPKEYLLDATENARQPKGFQINEAGPGFGYGYQFWLAGDRGAFAMMGVYGQTIQIFPRSRVVIVQTAAWESASPPESRAERSAALNAIVEALR